MHVHFLQLIDLKVDKFFWEVNMNNGLVSVVITSYNHEQYIEKCILSIFSQDYKNIELIILDDKSVDQSKTIIKNLLPKSPFSRTVLIVNEINLGLSGTRNKALEMIEGEYLLFVDSDNYLPLDYISKLVGTSEESKADIVYGNLVNADTGELFLKSNEFELGKLIQENFIDSCSLIKTEKMKNIKYDMNLNRKKMEDYDLFLNLIINNNAKAVYCPEANLFYRVLPDSISRKGTHKTGVFNFKVYLYILKKYIDKQSILIFNAISHHLCITQERLDNLISHHEEVTLYMQSMQKQDEKLNQQVLSEIENNRKLLAQIEEYITINKQLIQKNKNFEDIIQKQNSQNQALQADIELIRLSRSYRVGNLIVRPFGKFKKIIKRFRNKKELLNQVNLMKGKIVKIIYGPKYYFLKYKRQKQRKINNYINPKRVLVYVIYSDSKKIQQYKEIFLKALRKFVDSAIIVVNGSLDKSEIERLSNYGQVVLRTNEGYDAAAFKFGINYLGKNRLKSYDELLLVNDTNVGPFGNLKKIFERMYDVNTDFWGITYGEEQIDFTGENKYGFIPKHLQSYFLVIEKSLLTNDDFFRFWDNLGDTNSRDKAVGRYETTFTRYFEDLGYKHAAVVSDSSDSAMYIHPLQMIKSGAPLVKYAAFYNYSNEKFEWYGLDRQTEIPELINYIENKYSFPSNVISEIMEQVRSKENNKYILIIDGVENYIPQLTKYRVENKTEQLESNGFKVKCINLSNFILKDAEYASHIIIYRAPYMEKLVSLVKISNKFQIPVLYDIDDLVIDTKYTNQLSYTKNLTLTEKGNYDIGVINYGKMLKICDGAITSTTDLKKELQKYVDFVLLNRNLANEELVSISKHNIRKFEIESKEFHIGYFSGSISHNENFNLIRKQIFQLLKENKQLKLHLVGYLSIPEEFESLNEQIITHDFVDWQDLPKLINQVDLNLAPLVDSIFNRAKSEIKWIEASLVKVPTLASDVGSFSEMIENEVTGWLVKDNEWYEKINKLIHKKEIVQKIGDNAYEYVMGNCLTMGKKDELVNYLNGGKVNE